MISIAMPVYESFGRGVEFLSHHFEKFETQTYKNFEVVISVHSKTDAIEDFCKNYKTDNFTVKYERNREKRGNFTFNTNKAMQRCTGKIIKILYQDDFLWDDNSLQKIEDSFDDETKWLVTSYAHTHDGQNFFNEETPVYNEKIYTGNNTIGNPSVLSVRNDDSLLMFDEKMIWAVDIDYYKRLHDNFGPPKILNEKTVAIRLWDKQMTHLIPPKRKAKEISMSIGKHEK